MLEPQRIKYGDLSFVPPAGFEVLEEASLFVTQNGDGQHTGITGTPTTLTLVDTAVPLDVPDYSESSNDMNPSVYPANLTLSIKEQGGSPLAVLRNMERVMQGHFAGYEIHFFEDVKIGEFSAARSQSAYTSNFKIFRLNYVWYMDTQIVTACLTISESRVRQGWNDLLAFAVSVRLSPGHSH